MNPPSMPAKFISVVRIGSAMMQAIDAGDDEVAEGVDGRRLERVDLLGHAHRAELGADAGADAARQEQAGGQRPRLPHQRNRQARRDHRFGAEALERRARVHRQHDADREAGDGDERRRAQAELVDLADGFAEFEGRDEDLAGRLQREQRDLADRGERRVSARSSIRRRALQGACP